MFRDHDRERAQARGTAKGKGKDDGLTPEHDGKALQEKAAKKAVEGAGSGHSEGKSTKK
ncbi:hypothetical protein CsSME_00038951 [Camellia sinensis var. sinensis]